MRLLFGNSRMPELGASCVSSLELGQAFAREQNLSAASTRECAAGTAAYRPGAFEPPYGKKVGPGIVDGLHLEAELE